MQHFLTSAVEVAIVADYGAGAPVEAAAKLVPYAVGVLVAGAAVVEHAVPQHLQPRALQLRYAPVRMCRQSAKPPTHARHSQATGGHAAILLCTLHSAPHRFICAYAGTVTDCIELTHSQFGIDLTSGICMVMFLYSVQTLSFCNHRG